MVGLVTIKSCAAWSASDCFWPGHYIAGGSPKHGGGNQTNMEVYNKDSPSGSPSVAGSFLYVSETEIMGGAPRVVTLKHLSRNQCVLVNLVSLTGPAASDFKVMSNVVDPFLVGMDEQYYIVVEYSGSVDGATAYIEVTFGKYYVLFIDLVGKLPAPTTGRPTVHLMLPTRLPPQTAPAPGVEPTSGAPNQFPTPPPTQAYVTPTRAPTPRSTSIPTASKSNS
jgi:hypothetical protein